MIVNCIPRFRFRINDHSKSAFDQFTLPIVDPYGHPIVEQRRILSFDSFELSYQPMPIGGHQLTISFNNQIHGKTALRGIQDEINYLSKFKQFGSRLERRILDWS